MRQGVSTFENKKVCTIKRVSEWGAWEGDVEREVLKLMIGKHYDFILF